MSIESFIFYRSFYDAMEELPDVEYLKVSRAINRYALNGELSELEGISKAIFILIKPQLDANKRKRENGSHGGRPKETKPEPNQNLDITEPEPNVNGNININENENSGNGNNEKKPKETTTTISNFLEECKKAGYGLDELFATEIFESGIDPGWLVGPFSYPRYISGVIREAYPGRPFEDSKKLFLKGFSWQDRREQFVEWREKQFQAAEAELELQRKEVARADRPTNCQNCGTALQPDDLRACPSCGWVLDYDEEKEKYIFSEPANILEAFNTLIKNHKEKTESEVISG